MNGVTAFLHCVLGRPHARLLGAADEKKYGKGCNSKFYAFSGFMNPRLSALLCTALLPAHHSIPAHPE